MQNKKCGCGSCTCNEKTEAQSIDEYIELVEKHFEDWKSGKYEREGEYLGEVTTNLIKLDVLFERDLKNNLTQIEIMNYKKATEIEKEKLTNINFVKDLFFSDEMSKSIIKRLISYLTERSGEDIEEDDVEDMGIVILENNNYHGEYCSETTSIEFLINKDEIYEFDFDKSEVIEEENFDRTIPTLSEYDKMIDKRKYFFLDKIFVILFNLDESNFNNEAELHTYIKSKYIVEGDNIIEIMMSEDFQKYYINELKS